MRNLPVKVGTMKNLASWLLKNLPESLEKDGRGWPEKPA
jgi:hypothetical protein